MKQPESPLQFYRQTIEQCTKSRNLIRQKSRWMVFGKLVSFLLIALFIYLSWGDINGWTVVGMLCLTASYVYFFVVDELYRKQMQSFSRKIEVCENELKYLKGDFTPFADGREFADMHHPFAFDLDLFGATSLYQRINRTILHEGAAYLAHQLTTLPTDEATIITRQESIAELSKKNDFRVAFLSCGPINSSLNALNQHEKHPSETLFNSKRFMFVYLSIGITLSLLILSPFVEGAVSWFGVALTFQLCIALAFMKLTQHMVKQTDDLRKGFGKYIRLLQCIKEESFDTPHLQKLQASLFNHPSNSFVAFRQLSTVINRFDQRNGVGFILFNGLFLMDLLTIKQFIEWKAQHQTSLQQWMHSLAEWDALVSQATYSFNHPERIQATLLPHESSCLIEAEAIYHPFLSADKAVKNNFSINLSDVCIITGANMAGKSTFLRTMGVNYLLAANGMCVCSDAFRFTLVSLFSSMRTSDNLAENISYFNAELIRLEQLITHAKSQRHTFIILDEILKGTNSKDKLQGSILFLEKMQTLPVTVIVATHDLELAKLGDKYPHFHNYSFEIELADEIHYTYKIKEGVAQNLNATYLLQNLLKKI